VTFRAPVDDLMFALYEAAGFERVQALFPDLDADTVRAIFESAGALAGDVLAPLNRAGDLVGAQFENGVVRAAPGFGDAYKAFAQGGWNSLAADQAYGGQGLPKALEIGVFEMIQAANLAFGLCPMLTQGAIEALSTHGTQRQKDMYLGKLVSGAWTGTMNLTEPQAGSDLGLLTTKAHDAGDGSYRLSGQKIFITWGDHDVTDNIVHLVLARIAGAPEGVRGISLFVCPKVLVGEDGTLGEANALRVGGIEHKLGIHASPTCVMLFEGAKAELVGTANQGLAHMFTMMNAARLQVGTQGTGIAERAYQQALAFSLERKQGRSAWTGEHPARLFDHPDVRRTLMLMKAKTQAARAICLSTAVAADLSRIADSEGSRGKAKLREELLTPIAKGWSTDVGVEVASMAVQVHGGMGFIEETGAAQHYRDARILPIYEGTNGIQAIDLMGRKLGLADGQAVRDLVDDIWVTAAALKSHDNASLHKIGARLETGLGAVQGATSWLMQRRGRDEPDALAGATAYLQLMGDVVGGWLLGKQALAAAARMDGGEGDARWRTRIGLVRVYADQVLAGAPGLALGVSQGAADLAQITPETM
jgi:alkylation response protein AidB-like acyl-CoA dehydrogenase